VTWPVLTSASVPAKTVIAVATNAIVSAVEGAPAVDASQEAEIHRETVPGEIVDIGGVFARPVKALFLVGHRADTERSPVPNPRHVTRIPNAHLRERNRSESEQNPSPPKKPIGNGCRFKHPWGTCRARRGGLGATGHRVNREARKRAMARGTERTRLQ
jgi:hypothetical protein